MKQITYAILGYGGRGSTFAELAKLPHINAKIVAVAEPDMDRRAQAAHYCEIPDKMVFKSAEELLAGPRLSDGIINTTMDKLHAQTSLLAMKKGYHLLLEKPMAVTLEDCQEVEKIQRETGVVVAVCHSLRYNDFYDEIKSMIIEGDIGEIVTFDQLEGVGDIHYSSSYVRGNWGNEGRSAFMLMSKSCHDIDIFSYLTAKKCIKVSSFGSLSFFKKEHRPAGAPEYCLDGCPDEKVCPYHCSKIYLENPFWRFVFPRKDDESVREYLKRGSYGRCVFQCDNDVVDHQVVNFEYESGITGTFTMTAFNAEINRYIRVHGTKGVIAGNLEEREIVYRNFLTRNLHTIKLPVPKTQSHGGGDALILESVTNAIREKDPQAVLTTAQESLESHRIVFAAEEARRTGSVVSF
jgi:predicted dehydrogenase